jgi:hypothetical protein
MNASSKKIIWASRISQSIVLLALIRCIIECFPFRITLRPEGYCFDDMQPYLIASLVCAISSFVSLFFSFCNYHKIIIGIAIITISILVYIKSIYL